MTEPTDDEIVALAVAEGVRVKTGTGAIHLVRAALRSWGQPSGTGEPVGTIKSWTNGSYCRNYKVEWHRNDLPEGAQLYTTQQPTQPQAGAVPLTDAQIAEMMRDTWGCASIAPRHAPEFARAVERAHGIKGANHDR